VVAVTERPFGVSTVMDIHDAAWSELMGREDPFPASQGRPYWRPSSLGYCMRRQFLWRSGVPETRVDEDTTERERKFAWGRDIENHVRERMFRAGLLIESSVEVVDETLAVRGQIDFVWGGVVANDLPERADRWSAPYRWAILTIRERVAAELDGPLPITGTELKSTTGYSVSKMVKEGPRFDYRVQAGVYFALAQRHPEQFTVPLDQFEIVVVGRDAVRPIRFGATQEDVDLALERVDALNTAWEAQWAPPCTCGQTEGLGWEQKYCPYATGEDECCGDTLLDKLERSVEESSPRDGVATRETETSRQSQTSLGEDSPAIDGSKTRRSAPETAPVTVPPSQTEGDGAALDSASSPAGGSE
jgi:hypothetical protein